MINIYDNMLHHKLKGDLSMLCPYCKKEIKNENTVCPDCGSNLVVSLSGDSFRLEAMKPVLLISVVNNYDAGIILNLLENNSIPCFKKDKFVGGYMNLLMGYSVYGQDIYVDEEDYDRAVELIQILEPTDDFEDNPTSSADVTDKLEDYPTPSADVTDNLEDYGSAAPDTTEDASLPYPVFYKNPHIVARIILGFLAAGTIAAAIISAIYSK